MQMLFGRRVTEIDKCSIFQEVVENWFHAMVHYPSAEEVWKIMKANDFKLPIANEAMQFWEWWAETKVGETKDRSQVIAVVWWTLWKNRNSIIWHRKGSTVGSIFA